MTFKKIIVSALSLAIALGVAVSANAAAYTFTRSLTVGSRGNDVTALQEVLVSGGYLKVSPTGYFGTLTKAAVIAWQRAAGVTPAVGYFGPISQARLAMSMSGGMPAPVCPLGFTCTSNSTPAPVCPLGFTCTSNSTGSTGSTVSGSVGTLTSVTKLGSYNNTKVSEGDKDVAVLGIELTAKDGDQRIDGLKVALKNTNGSSNAKIAKYATEISVWLDGKQIARKSISSFSDDANDLYTYRFTGMNGVVKQNQKSQILVALSGASSIDSTDATNETWFIGAGTVNTGDSLFLTAVSSDGRFDDYGPRSISSSINFQKAGGVSSDQKYRVSTASNNPVAQTTQVSRTTDTNDKLLLAFDVKAENGSMKVQRLPVTFTAASAGNDAVVPNVEAIVKSAKLYANGVKIADESITSGTGVQTITFGSSSKLQYAIAANATVRFEVRADLNDIEETGVDATDFDEGDTIVASYSSTNVTNSSIELDNVNLDTVSNRSGSATGEIQTARSTGTLVTMGSVSSEAPVTNTSGDILSRTINIPVTVRAFDDTVYLPRVVNQGTTTTANGTASTSIAFTIEDSTGAASTTITSTATISSNSATVEGSAYRVDSGSERTFTVTVTIPGQAGNTIKQYRVQLNAIQTFLDSAFATGVNAQVLTPSSAFESGYYTISR